MITSTSNAKLKNVIKCMRQSRERRKQGVFLVEGIRMFSEIPRELHVETFATEAFYQKNVKLFADISYEIVAEHVMETLADTRNPQGVISVVKQLSYNIEQLCGYENQREGAPLLIAMENIQDPGNLGTIVRTAEGAGVTGILLSRDTVDIYNPKVVRATMGSIFRVPFCYVEDLVKCIQDLSLREFQTYSTHLQGTSFYDFDYQNPTVFIMGNEGNGISKELSAAAQHRISIPMMGHVESLNVATASTVLMYEAMRQRNFRSRQK